MGWMNGWNYRKGISLSRASGAVTNYQMKLLLGESAGAVGGDVDCGGLCLSTFNDIRFTNADGTTLLDYWIESLSGTTPNQLATIWIEFDSIGTTATTFYMYCGKSGASAVSSGANTFLMFDDFERGVNGDAVGGSWSVLGGSVTISTNYTYGTGSRSCKVGESSVTNHALLTVVPVDQNVAIRTRIYKINANSAERFNLIVTKPYMAVLNILNTEVVQYLDTSFHACGSITADAWNLLEIRNNNLTAHTYDIAINDSVVKSSAPHRNEDWGGSNFVYVAALSGNNQEFYIDNLIQRHFRTTEPAWGTWGPLESKPPFVKIYQPNTRWLDHSIMRRRQI